MSLFLINFAAQSKIAIERKDFYPLTSSLHVDEEVMKGVADSIKMVNKILKQIDKEYRGLGIFDAIRYWFVATKIDTGEEGVYVWKIGPNYFVCKSNIFIIAWIKFAAHLMFGQKYWTFDEKSNAAFPNNDPNFASEVEAAVDKAPFCPFPRKSEIVKNKNGVAIATKGMYQNKDNIYKTEPGVEKKESNFGNKRIEMIDEGIKNVIQKTDINKRDLDKIQKYLKELAKSTDDEVEDSLKILSDFYGEHTDKINGLYCWKCEDLLDGLGLLDTILDTLAALKKAGGDEDDVRKVAELVNKRMEMLVKNDNDKNNFVSEISYFLLEKDSTKRKNCFERLYYFCNLIEKVRKFEIDNSQTIKDLHSALNMFFVLFGKIAARDFGIDCLKYLPKILNFVILYQKDTSVLTDGKLINRIKLVYQYYKAKKNKTDNSVNTNEKGKGAKKNKNNNIRPFTDEENICLEELRKLSEDPRLLS